MHTMRKITKAFLRRASGEHPFTMSVNSSKLRRGRVSLEGMSRWEEEGHNEPCGSFPWTESLCPM